MVSYDRDYDRCEATLFRAATSVDSARETIERTTYLILESRRRLEASNKRLQESRRFLDMAQANVALARLYHPPHNPRMTPPIDDYERGILEMQDRIATMSDAEVKQAYEATDGQPGDAWTDALAAALEERNIDI